MIPRPSVEANAPIVAESFYEDLKAKMKKPLSNQPVGSSPDAKTPLT